MDCFSIETLTSRGAAVKGRVVHHTTLAKTRCGLRRGILEMMPGTTNVRRLGWSLDFPPDTGQAPILPRAHGVSGNAGVCGRRMNHPG